MNFGKRNTIVLVAPEWQNIRSGTFRNSCRIFPLGRDSKEQRCLHPLIGTAVKDDRLATRMGTKYRRINVEPAVTSLYIAIHVLLVNK